jgi:hypothetical protein
MYGIYESGAVIAKFVAPMSVRSNKPVFASDTLSLKRFVEGRSTQRWEIQTRVEPFNFSGNDFMVHMITKGHTETFDVLVPQNMAVVNNRDHPPQLAAVGSTSDSQVTITFAAGGLIPKGTFVRFAGHSKIYMTKTDATGSGALGIFPPLVADVNGLMNCEDNVLMVCQYDLDTVIGMQYQDGILTDNGVIKMVEIL